MVMDEVSKQHAHPMAMMWEMRKEMETMRKKHEDDLKTLRTENALMNQKMGMKELIFYSDLALINQTTRLNSSREQLWGLQGS